MLNGKAFLLLYFWKKLKEGELKEGGSFLSPSFPTRGR